MPAIRENNNPSIVSVINGNKNKYVIKAPSGSDRPDTKV